MKKKLVIIFISIFLFSFISIAIIGEMVPTENDKEKFNAPTTNLVNVSILGHSMPYARWWYAEEILANAHYIQGYDHTNNTYLYIYHEGQTYYIFKDATKSLEQSASTPNIDDIEFSYRRFDVDTSIEENRINKGQPLFFMAKDKGSIKATTVQGIIDILGNKYIRGINVGVPTIYYSDIEDYYGVDNEGELLELSEDNAIVKGFIYNSETISYIDHEHDMELNIIGKYIVFRQIQYDTKYPYSMRKGRDSSILSLPIALEYLTTAVEYKAPLSRYTYFDLALTLTLLVFPVVGFWMSKGGYRAIFLLWVIINVIGQTLGTMFIIGMSR